MAKPQTSTVDLTATQISAIDQAEEWLNNWDETKFPFRICGYAGTGKTTLLLQLIDRMKLSFAAAAYTGKAALVMRKYNRIPATTIHSLIYKYIPVDKELCEELYSQINDEKDPKKREELQRELDEAQSPHFELNHDSELVADSDLIVLDECSMVNDEILEDLRSFNKPIIALGDPGQLPPIDGTGSLFVRPPEIMLEEIHRQALDNPIIAASMRCRRGIPLAFRDGDNDNPLRVLSVNDSRMDELLLSHDQVLCGKNQTRRELNERIRRLKGFQIFDPYPEKGDKIICTRNNKEKGLFNGQMAEVISRGEILDNAIQYVIKPEDAKEEIEIEIARADFDEYIRTGAVKEAKWWELKADRFDFGYAITVHKSQGSQWPSVLIYDDRMFAWGPKHRVQRAQWLYTGVTRAAERLTMLR